MLSARAATAMDEELKRRLAWFTNLGAELPAREGGIASELDRLVFLLALADMDADAALTFRVVAREIPDAYVAAKLNEFSNDHERHLAVLRSFLAERGLQDSDARCFEHCSWASLAASMTSLRVGFGFVALQSTEIFTNAVYRAARQLVPEARDLLESALQDERKHAQWIVECLKAHWHSSWDEELAPSPVSYVRDTELETD